MFSVLIPKGFTAVAGAAVVWSIRVYVSSILNDIMCMVVKHSSNLNTSNGGLITSTHTYTQTYYLSLCQRFKRPLLSAIIP